MWSMLPPKCKIPASLQFRFRTTSKLIRTIYKMLLKWILFFTGRHFTQANSHIRPWHYVIFPIGSSRICYETWRSASPSEHTQTWLTEQFKAPSAVSGKDKTRHLAQMHKFNWPGHVSPAFLVDSLLWSFSLLGLLKTPWSMCMYVWRGLGAEEIKVEMTLFLGSRKTRSPGIGEASVGMQGKGILPHLCLLRPPKGCLSMLQLCTFPSLIKLAWEVLADDCQQPNEL